MSDAVLLMIGGCTGVIASTAVVMLDKIHVHKWGNWSRERFTIVNRGYESDRQVRRCQKCHREKVRPL